MKKILGYGYKLSKEKLNDAMLNYTPDKNYQDAFHKTRNEVLLAISYDRKEGIIGKTAKPQIFRVVVEIEENV